MFMFQRIQPSENWIQSQIPEVVKNGVSGLGNKTDDVYEMDAEAFVQAYVNIIVGACISLGKFYYADKFLCIFSCFLFQLG